MNRHLEAGDSGYPQVPHSDLSASPLVSSILLLATNSITTITDDDDGPKVVVRGGRGLRSSGRRSF